MRKFIAPALLCIAVVACKGTGKEGEVVVDKPVVGIQKDTLQMPVVQGRMDTATVAVPKVEMKKDSAKILIRKSRSRSRNQASAHRRLIGLSFRRSRSRRARAC